MQTLTKSEAGKLTERDREFMERNGWKGPHIKQPRRDPLQDFIAKTMPEYSDPEIAAELNHLTEGFVGDPDYDALWTQFNQRRLRCQHKIRQMYGNKSFRKEHIIKTLMETFEILSLLIWYLRVQKQNEKKVVKSGAEPNWITDFSVSQITDEDVRRQFRYRRP